MLGLCGHRFSCNQTEYVLLCCNQTEYVLLCCNQTEYVLLCCNQTEYVLLCCDQTEYVLLCCDQTEYVPLCCDHGQEAEEMTPLHTQLTIYYVFSSRHGHQDARIPCGPCVNTHNSLHGVMARVRKKAYVH